MKLYKQLVASAAAMSLLAIPVAAQAAQASQSAVSKLSVRQAAAKQVRAGANVRDANRMGGSALLWVAAAVAVVVGIVLIADGSDSP